MQKSPLLLDPKTKCQHNVKGVSTIFGIALWEIQRAAGCHQVIIELTAAFLGNRGYRKIATMSEKRALTEHQQLLALHRRLCEGCVPALIHHRTVGRLSWRKAL